MTCIRILVATLFLLNGGWLFAQTTPPAESETQAEPATLSVWHREIVDFRATLGALTPEQRRDMVLRRLTTIRDFDLYTPIRMEFAELGPLRGYAFAAGDTFLFTLLEQDLDPGSKESLEEVSTEVKRRLDVLRVAKLEQRNWKVIARGALFTLFATVVFAIVLWGLGRLGRIVRRFFVRRMSRIRDLKRENFDFRPVVLQIFRRCVSAVVWTIGFFAGYLWLTFSLAQFPYSAPLGHQLGDQVIRIGGQMVSATLGAVPGILIVFVILLITRGAARITDQLLRSYEASQEEDRVLPRDTARATRRIASTLIWIFGLVLAYPYIPGSDSEAFKGVSVLFGLMISLGSAGFVNQIMSGFVILYSGAIRSGEFVQAGNTEGTVMEIGLLSTKILTTKNEFVAIPNAVIISKETVNYSRMEKEGRTELFTTVTIGYDTPWKLVHKMLLEAADRTPGIRDKPEPRVLQTALSDFYVEYDLRFVPAEVRRKGVVLSDLHQRIQDVFQENSVQIMSPNFVSQPDEPVLPAAEPEPS